MKLKELSKSFLYLVIGVSLATSITSFTSNGTNNEYKNNDSVVETNNVEVYSDEGDTSLGTLNSDLEIRVRNYAVTDLTASFQLSISFKSDGNLANNYYVGYYAPGYDNYGAQLSFDLKESDGDIVKRTALINRVQDNSYYDGIGSSLGYNSLSTFCDININYGEEVLFENGFQLINVFSYDPDTKTVDLENPTYIECNYQDLISPYYPTHYEVADFFKVTYNRSSNFSNYSSFIFDVENYGDELYPTLTATTDRAYSTNIRNLENGTYYIRSKLSFGGDTQFVLTYDDGTEEVINSSSKAQDISHNGEIALLFEGIDANRVVNIEIRDIYYQMEIFNTETNSALGRTSFSQRFGRVYTHMSDLYDSNGNVALDLGEDYPHFNGDLFVILVATLSTAIFFGIVIPSYFYLKKKNRNDEFKRMNTKQYFTTATYGYLCIESLLLLFSFILLRVNFIDNTLIIYNPTDVYIIVFGVMSIILVGYFIRYFIVMFKNHREKVRRDKLKINQDVIDDGTLIIRK